MARVAAAADAELDRSAGVAARLAGGERAAHRTLLGCRTFRVSSELEVVRESSAPPLAAAGRLEPRDGGHEVRAGQVVRGGKRLAACSVRRLLGDGRRPERAAGSHAAKGARLPSKLSLDERSVIHRRAAYVARRAIQECP